jgi:hypothetical protein
MTDKTTENFTGWKLELSNTLIVIQQKLLFEQQETCDYVM